MLLILPHKREKCAHTESGRLHAAMPRKGEQLLKSDSNQDYEVAARRPAHAVIEFSASSR